MGIRIRTFLTRSPERALTVLTARRSLNFSLVFLFVLVVAGGRLIWKGHSISSARVLAVAAPGDVPWGDPAPRLEPGEDAWADSLGDGFPDNARLDRAPDRENFARWIAFLGESQYYRQSSSAREEIRDCSALIRYAFRNALVAHTPAWRRTVELPYDPGFPDVAKFSYPNWPLGRGLFRTRPGPFRRADLEQGVFAEFSDTATLLRYNAFHVSRDLRAAQRGDLLFFHQAGERQPYHSMLFIGQSNFQPEGSDWIVYHTGDIDGRSGEVREVRSGLLTEHPDPRWRPLMANPRFLGVYRFELLR